MSLSSSPSLPSLTGARIVRLCEVSGSSLRLPSDSAPSSEEGARSRDSLRAREVAFAPDEREEDVREASREEAPPVGRFFAVGFFLAPCMATMASQNDQRSIHTFAQIVAERQNQHGQMTAVLKMRTAF